MREMMDHERCILGEVMYYVISVYGKGSGKGAI